MSDANTPDPTPAPAGPAPTPSPAPASPEGQRSGEFQGRPGRPPQPGPARPGGASRSFGGGGRPPFPKGERTPNQGGTPQSLDRKDFAPLKPNSKDLDAMIEAELEAAMAGFDVSNTVAQTGPGGRPNAASAASMRGKKKGVVAGVHGKDVFIEVPGGRGQGVLPMEQFDRRPEVGDEVEFDIERYDAANGLLVLTRQGAVQQITDWSTVSVGMIVEAKVTGVNKNKTGLLIEVNGIKGFMPVSQVDLYRVENVDQFINQRLKCMVTEVVPEERNLLASRRALMEQERQVKAEQFWKTVQEGQKLTGIVRSVKPFGAFVDLGGQDGLIPVSEMSWSRVEDPSTILQIGQTVEVLVNRIDFDTRKIGLSLKQLGTSPWDEYAKRVRPGARVVGKVTRTADFGAFVELEPGVEGLVHISELSTQRVKRTRDVVQDGQTVEVEILNMDPQTRRIALSLKAIAKEGEEAALKAEASEREADLKAAQEQMASRPVNPNLRGGIGSRG